MAPRLTATNVFAVYEWEKKGCPDRVAPTHLPHLRRAANWGLLDLAKPGCQKVTPLGRRAIDAYGTRGAIGPFLDEVNQVAVKPPSKKRRR